MERPFDDPTNTQEVLSQLDQVLTSLDGRIIVALHFVPHKDFLVSHPYFQKFNAFLGSQAFHNLFVKHEVADVVFGHLHHRHPSRIIDGIHYHMQPLGYIREWQLTEDFFKDFPQYKIPQMYRLHKRYNSVKDLAEFHQYKRQHLASEFRQALTILDC